MTEDKHLKTFDNIVSYKFLGQDKCVVQNTCYDSNESAMYAVQSGKKQATKIFKSKGNLYEEGYESLSNSSKNPQIIELDSDHPLVLDNDLNRHTQTLIATGGNIITGINELPYEDFERLINASGQNYDKFFEDIDDNTSVSDFFNWNNHHYTKGYAHNFGIFSKNSKYATKFGRFVKVTGFAKALGLPNYNRIEAAVSPNQEYLLIAGNDSKQQKLVLNVYYFNTQRNHEFQDCSTALNNVSSLANSYNLYCQNLPYPDDPSKLSQTNLKKILDWLHEAFYYNQLVFDINTIPVLSHVELDYSTLLNLTNQISNYFSFQGFAIDDNKTIYLTSGFGPQGPKGNTDGQDWLLAIPNGGKDLSDAIHVDLSVLKRQIYKSLLPNLDTQFSGLYMEPEGLQVFNGDDSSLLSINISIHSEAAFDPAKTSFMIIPHRNSDPAEHISRLDGAFDGSSTLNVPSRPQNPVEHISKLDDALTGSSTSLSNPTVVQPTNSPVDISGAHSVEHVSNLDDALKQAGEAVAKKVHDYFFGTDESNTIGSWNFVCKI